MNPTEIKKLIIASAAEEADPHETPGKLEDEGVSFDFSSDFTDKVISRIFTEKLTVIRDIDFGRSLSTVFYRIALTGVAAIVILLLSIFLSEGSISFNSFLGMGNTYDESVLYLLTGI
ncbi:MAG: hypothetical protein GT600_04585 [Bacteroidales bacterium]|mgnify:FL=1|jgi:hypothetical protein|nr:hypothetical protein [Bacteroidales bacterium]NMD02949.1 hypothetical protein [Bacteroidales bacterium]OQB64055.1 MAG: hypothetical protein BWX96_00828 [Bacteroidetes bacterium ADurb.Bin145]HOU02188.1 hypothetical protein [Bacteroidales bacterium]HQK68210.1 hypothetical protein [Bacteroidales bacterium]